MGLRMERCQTPVVFNSRRGLTGTAVTRRDVNRKACGRPYTISRPRLDGGAGRPAEFAIRRKCTHAVSARYRQSLRQRTLPGVKRLKCGNLIVGEERAYSP